MTATKVPAEVPISEARAILTDLATAAKEHGARTALTKHGKTMAIVAPADLANCPSAVQWGAASKAFRNAMTNPQDNYREAILALGDLLRTWNGHGQPAAQTCGHCGTAITESASGTNWVDGRGWDSCESTGDSHEPAVTS